MDICLGAPEFCSYATEWTDSGRYRAHNGPTQSVFSIRTELCSVYTQSKHSPAASGR